MNDTTKLALGAAAALLCVAAAAGRCGYDATTDPNPGVVVDQPGDCDAGDLREKTPDPDCHGLWLGTPTPGAKKTQAPATRKTPAPRRTR